jgi:hypothetical protein
MACRCSRRSFDTDTAEALRQREAWRARGAQLFAVATDKNLFATAVARYRAAPASG